MKIETDLMFAVCRATDAMKCWLDNRDQYLPLIQDPLMKDVYNTWAFDKLYIQASGNKDQLTTLFRVLASHSFRLYGTRPVENQPEWSGYFRQYWIDNEGKDRFIEVYVSFTSTVCERRQVSTEMKEVPIYKIVCGDVISDEPVSIPDDIPF